MILKGESKYLSINKFKIRLLLFGIVINILSIPECKRFTHFICQIQLIN